MVRIEANRCDVRISSNTGCQQRILQDRSCASGGFEEDASTSYLTRQQLKSRIQALSDVTRTLAYWACIFCILCALNVVVLCLPHGQGFIDLLVILVLIVVPCIIEHLGQHLSELVLGVTVRNGPLLPVEKFTARML